MAASVGFIGVGNMGNPMAYNVLKAGFAMLVYDKNPQAMENLLQAGARGAASVHEVVTQSEITLTWCSSWSRSASCFRMSVRTS